MHRAHPHRLECSYQQHRQPGNNPNRPPQGNGNKQVKDAQSTSKSSSDWSDLDEFNW
jgi:hypothetical protein